MTNQIKVSEVSAILRQQLEGISTNIHTEEVGTVLQVSDGVARIYGLDNAEANELLEFDNGMEAIVMRSTRNIRRVNVTTAVVIAASFLSGVQSLILGILHPMLRLYTIPPD